jgi:hypothetical protein
LLVSFQITFNTNNFNWQGHHSKKENTSIRIYKNVVYIFLPTHVLYIGPWPMIKRFTILHILYSGFYFILYFQFFFLVFFPVAITNQNTIVFILSMDYSHYFYNSCNLFDAAKWNDRWLGILLHIFNKLGYTHVHDNNSIRCNISDNMVFSSGIFR